MKLIIGFGNPGREYLWTRHNFGHLALDFYAKTHGHDWHANKNFDLDLIKDGQNLFAKSHTYYNEVGLPIRKVVDFYKLNPATDILVVCDDLNLDFGRMRYRESGGHGGNNGLKSLILHLGTKDFQRLRLGTDNALRAQSGDTDFVLGKFSEAERDQLPDLLAQAATQIDDFIAT